MLASADLDFFILVEALRRIAMSVGPVVMRRLVTLFESPVCFFLDERFRRTRGGWRLVTETLSTGLKRRKFRQLRGKVEKIFYVMVTCEGCTKLGLQNVNNGRWEQINGN